MFRVPDSVVTRRPFMLSGVAVPAGTTLSKAQVVALGRSLDALLDSGYVVALPDPFARKGRAVPRPSSLPPVIRDAMVAKLTGAAVVSALVTVVGGALSVVVSGGVPSFEVSLDGGKPQHKSSRTFAFTGVSAGEHEVTVVDGSGGTESVAVTVTGGDPVSRPKKKAE